MIAVCTRIQVNRFALGATDVTIRSSEENPIYQNGLRRPHL
jgi:hypothetical protein